MDSINLLIVKPTIYTIKRKLRHLNLIQPNLIQVHQPTNFELGWVELGELIKLLAWFYTHVNNSQNITPKDKIKIKKELA